MEHQPPPSTKAEKRRRARQRKKLRETIMADAEENEARQRKEALLQRVKERRSAMRDQRQARGPAEINPDTGEKMNKKYRKEFAKYVSGDGTRQILSNLGVEDPDGSVTRDVRQRIARGEIKDSQQLVQKIAEIVQERGPSIATRPDSAAAQIKEAAIDPNCRGIRFGSGPPPPEVLGETIQ